MAPRKAIAEQATLGTQRPVRGWGGSSVDNADIKAGVQIPSTKGKKQQVWGQTGFPSASLLARLVRTGKPWIQRERDPLSINMVENNGGGHGWQLQAFTCTYITHVSHMCTYPYMNTRHTHIHRPLSPQDINTDKVWNTK